ADAIAVQYLFEEVIGDRIFLRRMLASGMTMRGMFGRRSFGRRRGMAAMMAIFQVLGDVLEGEFGWLFTAPIVQPSANGLGVFKARNIVATIAAILGN